VNHPRLRLLAAAAVLMLSASSVPGLPSSVAEAGQEARDTHGKPEFRDDELLVKFKPGAPAASRAAAHQQAGGREDREIAALDVKVVKVPRGQAENRLRAYQNNPNVEYAELNGTAYATWSPNDANYGSQWALNNQPTSDRDIDAPQAWDKTKGSSSTRIAILDTGVRESHPDLTGKVVARNNWTWMDAIGTEPNRDATDDRYGHGTHVAGIAAALTNNGTGIAGVCPDCSLVAVKVLNDDGSGAYDYIANGILWTVGCDVRDNAGNCQNAPRANVINLSLGGTYNSITLQDAVNKAWNRGVVLSCAAGNNGNSVKFYPAAYTNCIAVAATDSSDRKAAWSNYGKGWVDVAAPGVDILSSVLSGGYEPWSGTSMATPHVSGLAGLLASQGKGRDAIRSSIESTADRISGTGNFWSKGRINACKAVGGSGC
jgi:thermitase